MILSLILMIQCLVQGNKKRKVWEKNAWKENSFSRIFSTRGQNLKPETILKKSLLIQSGIREAVCQFNPYSSWFCSWVCSQEESSEWGKRGHRVLRYSLTDKALQDNMQKLKIDNIEHVCLKQTYNQTKFFLNNMKTTYFL